VTILMVVISYVFKILIDCPTVSSFDKKFE
jgi:hypothetical protein